MESLFGLPVSGSSVAKHGAQSVLTETILRTPTDSASEAETSSFVEEDGDTAEQQNGSSLHGPQETSINNPSTTSADDEATTTPVEVSPGAAQTSPRSGPSANRGQEDATQDKENAHVPVAIEMHNDQPVAAEDEANRRKQELRKRLQVLRTENRRLKERQTCRNCHERPVSLTLLPCGHFCFCEECGSKFTACPICRKTILADVRTFVS